MRMKNFIFGIVFMLFSGSVLAQQNVPNADFENWENSTTPEDWSISLNGNISGSIPLSLAFGTRSMDAHSGVYALKIQPQAFSLTTANIPGFCQMGEMGEIDVSLETLEALIDMSSGDFSSFSLDMLQDVLSLGSIIADGCAVSEIPSEVRAWVKFYPDAEASDAATLIVIVYRYSSILQRKIPVAYGSHRIEDIVSDYSLIQFAVNGIGSDTDCDSLSFIMMVGGSNPSPATEFLIDDISLHYNTQSIDQQSAPTFSIFPNPTSSQLRLTPAFEGEYSIRIFDVTGKLISTEKFLQNTSTVNVSNYKSGIYFIELNNGFQVSTLKFVVE